MSERLKWVLVLGVSIIALAAAATVGVAAWQQYRARLDTASAAAVTSSDDWAAGPRVVFRNTAAGEGYGRVASVGLDDPSGARAVTDAACDRVDAAADEFSCLRIERTIVPTYSATLYANDGEALQTWPLPGIPSRTRISDDGTRIATTSFVTGHSYATIGFSTETVVHGDDGASFGNLESWTFVVDGEKTAPADRNFWGVTFIDDGSFYATAGLTTADETYLIRGDIASRTLSTVAADVECPSLSPDGTRVAFKSKTRGSGPTAAWAPAVMDLATGEITLLPESRTVDDQIEWLDDDTILYGMPRDGAAGDYDVWALSADGRGTPEIFIEHAWSPSVVRP
ncbi:MAG TPA: hypothetical protein VJU58_02815 [Microbacterium sp.]|nr:hypothetical protein [Microbacterium sp.]